MKTRGTKKSNRDTARGRSGDVKAELQIMRQESARGGAVQQRQIMSRGKSKRMNRVGNMASRCKEEGKDEEQE